MSAARDNTHALSSAQKQSPQARLPWLAPVRMLIIAFIAFGYASTMPRGPGTQEYLHVFGYDPSWYGLSLVFMISGFLALRSLRSHGSAAKFLSTRIGRNLPMLALFALLVIFVLYPLFGVPIEGSSTRLAQFGGYFLKVVSCFDPNVLTPGLLDNALYMCVVQGGLWSFRWGLIAYLATSLLWATGGLRDRRTLGIITLGTIFVYASLVMYAAKTQTAALEFPITGLRLGWIYMAGMYAYACREHLPRTLLIPTALIGFTALQFYVLPWTPFIEISMTLGLSYLAFLAMTHRARVPESFAKIPDISLGLFIFNWPMAQIVLLLIPSLGPLALFGLSFPLAILLSLLCWLLITRPSLPFLRRVAAA